tara:strand:- start:121 stop:552 length:432 start_codon:yes stop_codon:yes gene_type:complete
MLDVVFSAFLLYRFANKQMKARQCGNKKENKSNDVIKLYRRKDLQCLVSDEDNRLDCVGITDTNRSRLMKNTERTLCGKIDSKKTIALLESFLQSGLEFQTKQAHENKRSKEKIAELTRQNEELTKLVRDLLKRTHKIIKHQH